MSSNNLSRPMWLTAPVLLSLSLASATARAQGVLSVTPFSERAGTDLAFMELGGGIHASLEERRQEL